jgi:iron-sulfur cluster insertion protein
MNDPVIFTHNAAAKVWELIQEEGNFNLKLRVYVTGGGCSGFQYGFTFDETVSDDDTVVIKNIDEGDDSEGEGSGGHAVQLLIDPMSFQYLAGSEIDYKEDLEGAQFIIRNPNAKTTCGCGSSFSA